MEWVVASTQKQEKWGKASSQSHTQTHKHTDTHTNADTYRHTQTHLPFVIFEAPTTLQAPRPETIQKKKERRAELGTSLFFFP